jgi:peptide/nickel transport system substrate-binding protein
MIPARRSTRSRVLPKQLIGGAAVVILLAACGGKDADSGSGAAREGNTRSEKGESGLADAGAPVRGGRLVYALEAESSGGFCLPEARLNVSGVMVRTAIYDTLTVVNAEGKTVPGLAKSVTPNATFDEWTMVVRDGVKFHDGTKLDATVVKNNIDAWRGSYPGRTPTLSIFTLANVDTVTVTDSMTVVLTTKVPWVAFMTPWIVMGIMAQAQLDDADNCSDNMIGTGPFKLATWEKEQKLIAQRNPEYWQIAPDGEPYPYLDAVEFRPINDSAQRINALEAGEVNVMTTAEPSDIVGPLTDLRDDGTINLLVSEEHAQVDHVALNNSKAPFDDLRMRKAVALGLDREELNELTNAGFPTIADQPFPPGDPGYMKDPGFPDFDPEAAKALVDEYKAGGGDPSFTISVVTDPSVSARAQVIQQQLSEVGIEVSVESIGEAALIDRLIASSFEAVLSRYYPGGEPDEHGGLWYSRDNPVNFSKINSPVIDKALEEGRGESDPAKRQKIYERISKDFATNLWLIWLSYTPIAVALASDVHGIAAYTLPDDGGAPTISLSRGHSLQGMWIEA